MLIVGWHYQRKHKMEMTITSLEVCVWLADHYTDKCYMIWNNFLSRTCISVKSQINLIFSKMLFFRWISIPNRNVPTPRGSDSEFSPNPQVWIPNFPFIPQIAPHEIRRVPIPKFPQITPRFRFRISPSYHKLRLTKFAGFRFRISPK
jgi:hypothetical protein